MSSHWEWQKRVMAEHDAAKPFTPENGNPLRFKPGEAVIFRNDYRVEFHQRVTGYHQRPAEPCGLYARGCRYLLDKDCYWMPVTEASLRPDPELAALLPGGWRL